MRVAMDGKYLEAIVITLEEIKRIGPVQRYSNNLIIHFIYFGSICIKLFYNHAMHMLYAER